jgi:hypothetical protein
VLEIIFSSEHLSFPNEDFLFTLISN